MGYSGYSQIWFKNGHYWIVDCYQLPQMYEEPVKQKCPVCKEEEVFENMVNVTNGSWDEDGTRIDGYVKPKIKSETAGKCSACGRKHVCEVTYEIPKKEEK